MKFHLIEQRHTDLLYPEVFGNGRFGRYSLSAFHDIRDDPAKMHRHISGPIGRFNLFNRKITKHARMDPNKHRDFMWQFVDDLVSFELDEIDAALDYVNVLRRHGRWAHAWETDQGFQLRKREDQLTVRLVRERVTNILEEVKWKN